MKRYQVINYHHLLSQIDLQKVDKDARAKLINLDIVLGDMVDAHNDEVEKVKTRLSKGHEAEIQEVSALISQLQTAEDKEAIKAQIDLHKDYAAIEQQLNDEISKRLIEDVDVDVDKISSADLAEWCAASSVRINLNVLRELRKAGLTN